MRADKRLAGVRYGKSRDEAENFSIKKHTWHEIAQAMCQAELVHETNMALGFLPLIAVRWFGAFYVFLITSVCGALFDFVFVIMQRYNRTRVVRFSPENAVEYIVSWHVYILIILNIEPKCMTKYNTWYADRLLILKWIVWNRHNGEQNSCIEEIEKMTFGV